MKNKRGQGFTTGQLLALVLGAVAVVIVIIGFTQGWGFFTDLFGKSDIDMTLISQKCNAELSGGDTAGFCTNKIEVGNGKYINCNYSRSLGVKIEGNVPDCTGAEKQICQKIKLEEGEKYNPEKIEVNGKPCCKKKTDGTCDTDTSWDVA